MTPEYTPDGTWGIYTFQSRQPQFTTRYVDDMLRDPRVQLGLRTIKGPILSMARFYVDEPNSKPGRPSKFKKFLCKQIERFWLRAAQKALDSVEWGYHGSEALFQLEEDQIHFDNLKSFKARDVKLLTKEGKKVGIVVKGDKAKQRKTYIGGPKSFWTVHERHFHPYYGRSRLYGAFVPWWEFYQDGGAKDVRRLYYHKYAFNGDIGYYPVGDAPTTGGGPEGVAGVATSNKSLMREMLIKRKTGGNMVFPNKRDPEGNRLWEVEQATSGPPATDILEYHKDLKSEIMEGLGVPNEVVEAAEVGSGWSGRAVPQQAFFSMLQDIANFLIFDFDEQILRDLCTVNDYAPKYEIKPFGLAQDSSEEQDKEKEAAIGGGDESTPIPAQAREDARFAIAV